MFIFWTWKNIDINDFFQMVIGDSNTGKHRISQNADS